MADLPPEDWEFFDDDPEDDSNLGVPSDHLREIMETYGIVDFNEIVVDLTAVPNPQDIRGIRFSTLEEAVTFLFDIGVLSFSQVVTIDDVYAVIIGDSPSAGEAE
jgi:hypothetical protein